MKKQSIQNQSGVVSILSVIFFVILMSVLAVSFLRLVTTEQTQVIDDDLSKGALASAQSGVEDAKRALLYCRANPTGAGCSGITNQTCPGMFDASMQSVLGLNAQGDGSIRVGDISSNNNQRYTCVTVLRDTINYEGSVDQESMKLIPLRVASASSFNKIRLSWRQMDVNSPAPIPTEAAISALNGTAATNQLPRKPMWKNGAGVGYLAMPRLQIFNFDKTQQLPNMRDNSAGMFVVPINAGAAAAPPSNVPLATISPTALANKRTPVNCTSGLVIGYRCTMTVTLPAPNANQEYYLAIKSVYAPMFFEVALFNGSTQVPLNDVQPEVDSTGATANVYKRLISRVTYENDSFLSTSVLESGGGICKDYYVTRTTADEDTTCLGF